MIEHLFVSVNRGSPQPPSTASITQPTLVLAWAGDPGHPVSTAERLVELLPQAELHVATRIRDVLRWPAQVASFLDAT